MAAYGMARSSTVKAEATPAVRGDGSLFRKAWSGTDHGSRFTYERTGSFTSNPDLSPQYPPGVPMVGWRRSDGLEGVASDDEWRRAWTPAPSPVAKTKSAEWPELAMVRGKGSPERAPSVPMREPNPLEWARHRRAAAQAGFARTLAAKRATVKA